MKMGWWRTMGLCTALAVGALAAATGGASAQADDEDCRCVDADGNAIENCTCFVMPDFTMPDFDMSDFDMPHVMAFGPDGDFAVPFGAMRPRLGVSVDTDQDEGYDGQGARVTGVMENGPAAEAGIREGDVITSVDGRSLFEPLEDDVEGELDLDESLPVQRLLAIARELEPGESVEIGYLRDGEARTATVDVQDLAGLWGAWADDFTARFRPRMERFEQEIRPRMEELRNRVRDQTRELDIDVEALQDGLERVVVGRVGSTVRYGLRLTELTPGLGDYFGAEEGVLVTDVDDDSTLALRPGDVILRIGDREATSPSRVARILATYDEEESVTFRVLREGSEIDVMGRLND